MIDTHCHLQWEKFNTDRDAVMQRAADAGVTRMITLATNLATSYQVIELAEKYPCVYAGVGIHPTDAVDAGPDDLAEIERLAAHPKVVAIGETGMDFYWDASGRDVQEHFFREHLKLSSKLNMPVIVHNREAGKAIMHVVSSMNDTPLKGVFHCFAEDKAYADAVLRNNFHISFTGNITYKKSNLPEVSRHVPVDRLLLETDSPFLPPVPYRGRRNEPAFVKNIAEKHAEIRGLPVSELCAHTTENAERLFNF